METFEAIEKRRSVKHYDPEHVMTDEEISKLLELVALSPTSFNMQNWRFCVVKNKESRQKICEAAWNQAQVTEASLLIILCADLRAWAKEPTRYWKNAPEEVSKLMVQMMGNFYVDNEPLQRDEAMRSCGIAAQTLMLAAKDMGYDSNPMIGFDPVKVGEVIALPEDHVISMMLVVGKALKPARARAGQLPVSEISVIDKF